MSHGLYSRSIPIRRRGARSRELDLAVWTDEAAVLPGPDRRTLNVVALATWSRRAVYELAQPVIATRVWRSGDRRAVAALRDDGSVVWVSNAL